MRQPTPHQTQPQSPNPKPKPIPKPVEDGGVGGSRGGGGGGGGGNPIRLLRELATTPWPLAAALVLALTATAASLALPLLARDVITSFSRHESLLTPALWMCAAAVGGAAAMAGGAFLIARAGEQMVYRVRNRLMGHTLRLPLQTVRAQGTGNLTARITSDALQLRQVVDVGAQFPLAVLTVLATLGVMAWIDWVLTLVTLASLLLVTGVLSATFRRLRASITGQQIANGRIAQRFTSHLEALTAIKANRAEPLAARVLADDADVLRRESLTSARLQSIVPAATQLGNQFAMIAVILTGGTRVASGDLATADFAAFLLYLLQTIPSATTLTNALGRLQAGLAARDRCNELLALPDESTGSTAGPAPVADPAAPAVAFREVSFTHPGAGTASLRKISFEAPARGLTAFVGPSGAGKTTALTLMDRFVRPAGGTISVLGHDQDTWPLADLRGQIAYVDQKFTLIEASARDNLQLGRRTPATDAELARVLDALDLTDAISALPDGLDTVLGRETDLSGGQRQRMALARALLSDAKIVLLDEPTSQLDGINEQRFRNDLDTLAEDRAVIVVAHRLSTIHHARHVVLMDSGTVVDSGDHRSLMRRCPQYRDLVATQTLRETAATPVAAG
ncbi:ABC transporter ATP-binding protein [Streptomyces sp. ISL-43]|uniref:ABC transporter ATP-binding protein n=1 Tax=Streptomyces sp. ISL-43 TaxID=2819183 RepID=UPI001BE800CF|nr:ABC transporter ATP-binding protein [Streptomyces sp. ISL-43]MBT2446177.1 ABC transporter ATP-binding protein [Streptomyces sp. ISL-43]